MSRAPYGPFEPGKSPFRTKGNVYQNVVASYDERVPGGYAGVIADLDPDVRRFFEQRFEATATYDLFPILDIGQAAARRMGVEWLDFVRSGARIQAERDLKGIYRLFLKVASPRIIASRLPRIIIQYFTFGSVSGAFASDKTYDASVNGIPRPFVPWIGACAEGFIPTAMAAAGAKETAVVLLPFAHEGEEQGMELCSAKFSVTWK